jgi:integrase
MACYGLRPHELWHLDLEDLKSGGWTIRVLEKTKTGSRKVWPYHANWIEDWQMRDGELPWVDRSKPNRTIGAIPAIKFKEFGIPTGSPTLPSNHPMSSPAYLF